MAKAMFLHVCVCLRGMGCPLVSGHLSFPWSLVPGSFGGGVLASPVTSSVSGPARLREVSLYLDRIGYPPSARIGVLLPPGRIGVLTRQNRIPWPG